MAKKKTKKNGKTSSKVATGTYMPELASLVKGGKWELMEYGGRVSSRMWARELVVGVLPKVAEAWLRRSMGGLYHDGDIPSGALRTEQLRRIAIDTCDIVGMVMAMVDEPKLREKTRPPTTKQAASKKRKAKRI